MHIDFPFILAQLQAILISFSYKADEIIWIFYQND